MLNTTPAGLSVESLGIDEMIVVGAYCPTTDNHSTACVAEEGVVGKRYYIEVERGNLSRLAESVRRFTELAYEWDETTFYVTEIGCDIEGGFTPEEVAPLFVEAYKLYNVRLPESFAKIADRIVGPM